MLFLFTASKHATPLASIVIATTTATPLVILQVILKKYLIPRFLHRTRWLYYTHSFLLIVILTMFAVGLDIYIYRFFYINGYMTVPDDVRDTIQIGQTRVGSLYLHTKHLVLLSITMTVVTISHLLDERKALEILAKEHQMQQELKYLRAQINPHFLFNALNCIYSLALIQDEKAPDSILKLSEMLRYVIDECRADSVPIAKEVSYISNFIDFQKIRMEHEPNIVFECNIDNENYQIPPMIFQPMVENCFKHSRIIDNPDAYIKITLSQENEHITFCTDNSKPKNNYQHKDNERTGIGVNNVKQRLDLIFGDEYTFEIKDYENKYITKLYI